MRIRLATVEDGPTLMPFARQTFSDTYVGHPKSTADPAQRVAYMDATFTPAAYERELAEEGALFFVCEDDDEDDKNKTVGPPAAANEGSGDRGAAVPHVSNGSNSGSTADFSGAATAQQRQRRYMGYAKVVVGGVDESLKVGTNPTTGLPQRPIRLQRLYVGKEYIGKKGVGKQLLLHCFGIAQTHKCDLMWLGTWGENKEAIAFYEKHGFHISGELYFQQGNQRRVNTLMQREIPLLGL